MTNSAFSNRCRFAAKVAGVHLGINVVVAILVAAVVLLLWYPYPYRTLMGGLHLLLLIVVVDMVCGPVLSFILANPKKSKKELTLDLSLVVLVQLAALVYGLHAVAVARPVMAVFEVDRFTVVSAAEIDSTKLAQAPASLRSLSWAGVRRAGIRQPVDGDESMRSLEMSLQGVEPSARPDWWLDDHAIVAAQVRKRMQPLSVLLQHYPDNKPLAAAIAQSGLPQNALYFLPFTSQKDKGWVVLLDEQTQFKAFAQVDGFIQ